MDLLFLRDLSHEIVNLSELRVNWHQILIGSIQSTHRRKNSASESKNNRRHGLQSFARWVKYREMCDTLDKLIVLSA